MTNLSQEKRLRMLSFLETLRKNNQDDISSLRVINEIEVALNEKKYGLVWENHVENVDILIDKSIPVLEDIIERKIELNNKTPYNFLIEGDNLHALKILEKTHRGKVDVIYIDPPYNTGSKDFIYDDNYVNIDDSYRHSKWLSFMSKRLILARLLLKKSGFIAISIDDSEQAQLKLLCDEIFGEGNFIAELIWKKKKGGGNDSKYIATEHEYIIVFAKDKTHLDNIFIPHDVDYIKRYKECDEKGRFFWDTFKRKSGKQYYPIKCPDGTILEYDDNGDRISWLRSEERFYKDLAEGEVRLIKVNDKWSVHFKQRMPIGKKPRSILDDLGTTADGTALLEKVLMKTGIFDNPKPIELIKHLISYKPKDSLVLDFFAGSGTTGHAVMELNQSDGGNRRFILCTNNQNNIAEEVTYKRLCAIQSEIPYNLKYFRSNYISRFSESTYLDTMLLKYIAPLIELEYACDIDNSTMRIFLEEDEFDEFMAQQEKINLTKVFLASDILLSAVQEQKLAEVKCEIIRIPEYYYRDELIESGDI